jgi:hypothetical protein
MFITCSTPSGIVVGGGVGDRTRKLQINVGEEGSICDSPIYYRVMFVISKDHAITFFFVVIFVFCKLTPMIFIATFGSFETLPLLKQDIEP